MILAPTLGNEFMRLNRQHYARHASRASCLSFVELLTELWVTRVACGAAGAQ
jgi:hypothetical protein